MRSLIVDACTWTITGAWYREHGIAGAQIPEAENKHRISCSLRGADLSHCSLLFGHSVGALLGTCGSTAGL